MFSKHYGEQEASKHNQANTVSLLARFKMHEQTDRIVYSPISSKQKREQEKQTKKNRGEIKGAN